jgi:hypothetical protein
MVSSGGSHGSGKVEYPKFIDDMAQATFGTAPAYGVDGLASWVSAHEDDNPYEDIDAYDPTQALGRMVEAVISFSNYVEDIDHLGDYSGILDTAEAKANESDSILSDSAISEAVSQFAARERQQHNLSLSRFESGMAEINAVQSSSFVLGREMLEEEFTRKVADFDAQLTVEGLRMRQQYTEKAAGEMFRFLLGLVDARKALYATESEYARVKIMSERDQYDRDVILNHKERHWPLELYQYLANQMAAVGGGKLFQI